MLPDTSESTFLKLQLEKKPMLFLLAGGQLSYCSFPKITVPESLLMESKIVDFQFYYGPGPFEVRSQFLATVHGGEETRELKVFRMMP